MAAITHCSLSTRAYSIVLSPNDIELDENSFFYVFSVYIINYSSLSRVNFTQIIFSIILDVSLIRPKIELKLTSLSLSVRIFYGKNTAYGFSK